MKRLVCFTVVLVALSGAVPGAEDTPKVSKPFEYSGYTTPEYTSFKTFSQYVPMEDGEQLAIDVHLPTEGPQREAFPVILEYLPYQRSTINVETGAVKDVTGSREGRFFLSYGYALVKADMRGTGASTGWVLDFIPQLSRDGGRLVEWLSEQPWCDGKIGMKGSSYLGWSQMATAAQAPKGLQCIMPECIPLDGYTGEAYPGGIFLHGFFVDFSRYMGMIWRNMNFPDMGIRPTKPALDEDGDGELQDEIPVDTNGNGTFLDDGFPPAYRDGAERQHVYFKSTQQHAKGNYNYTEWASAAPFLDSPAPLDVSMYDLSPSGYVPAVRQSRVPIYHSGGWFDAFTRGTFELYCTMAGSNPSKLVIAPSYHDFTSGPFWKHFGVSKNEAEGLYLAEHLRFYDRYLKGIENGIDTEPPIYLYVMNGAGWRFEKEWPLARQQVKRLFFGADHTLAEGDSGEGSDAYQVDFTHDARYTESLGNRYLGIGMNSPQTPPLRTDKDQQCLSYTSESVDKDMEVTGHPLVRLWASSTAPDGDFFVYLEDVEPGGEALLVTEGQLRAGFALLRDNNTMIHGGITRVDVMPELPWHGFEKAQYNAQIFADDALIELVMDLNPTAWVFKAGHRIRVSIACADYPTFRLHPLLSPKNSPDAPDNILPIVTVYRGQPHASCVELPIIPAPDKT